MPRRRNQASSPAQAEEPTDEMETDETQPLQFDEALTWRAGRPIAVGELLRRLQKLYEELCEIEQEIADRPSLVPKAQELASPLLLAHKDKGVKAYAMLCIVEMFRLLAPDAPYKGGQLKDIFTLFISTILPALATPSDPYNTQHFNVLVSLATFKSIMLLADIPGSDHLILTLFTTCFDLVSGGVEDGGEQVARQVDFHMTGMLCMLVDECGTLPAGVTDIILAQFLRADLGLTSERNRKLSPQPLDVASDVSSAYTMARTVCTSCPQIMARNISQYFSSVLIDASQNLGSGTSSKAKAKKRPHDESDEEGDQTLLNSPSADDLLEVEKAHRLLRELWRSCPDAIGGVVPQIEAEIGADNVPLRRMAVQTIGDMIAGIGAAGPPQSTPLDPTAYPSQSLDSSLPAVQSQTLLTTPDAPYAFVSTYPTTHAAFMDRHRDKSAPVRSAWVTAAGRILFTAAGGKGLDADQESTLLRRLSDTLLDHDDRVRLAAVQAIANFDFDTTLRKLGGYGGVNSPGSVLCNLADRIKDTKHHVRVAAMELLGRIWGVASGAIIDGSERARELLGAIPSKIFDAVYVNDKSVTRLVQHVMFESLLPIAYPPSKAKSGSHNTSQRIDDSQAPEAGEYDPDKIRVERILALVRDLDDRARTVFFSLQTQQTGKAKYIESIIHCCETLHAEKQKQSRKDLETQRDKLIAALTNTLPDSSTASTGLVRFFSHYDRRHYALVRFCYSPESDYRKIVNAMKELTKRVSEADNLSLVLDTVLPLLRSASILVYNRSHVPAILDISSTDEKGLGAAAHALLKEISTKAPDVFKVHIKELCESLKRQAPSETTPNDHAAVDSLKACAGFAQRFPRDMPKDRDLYQAMMAFAKQGMPPTAAKHAITVMVASDERKQMHIGDVMKYCTSGFDYGCQHFLSKLAAISQMRLLANEDTRNFNDEVTELAVKKILLPVRTPHGRAEPKWKDEIDVDLNSKLWALKIVVNGLRGLALELKSEELTDDLKTASRPIFTLLNTLIENEGEMSQTEPTAEHHKARLRLASAKHLLKLCCIKALDRLFGPQDFNRLTKIVQDRLPEVRTGFADSLKKHLGHNRLPARFYALLFLYAFEPVKATKAATVTWLKARVAMFAKAGHVAVVPAVFARYLSLLAHHQDFPDDSGDDDAAGDDLDDFVEYLLFYLHCAAAPANLAALYSVAQRLKSVADGIDAARSPHLYVLSDLAEAVLRHFADAHGWSLQLLPGKAQLPAPLFAPLPSHAAAQHIAERRYIPDDLVERLDQLVRTSLKTKKRKSDALARAPPAAGAAATKKQRRSSSSAVGPAAVLPKATKKNVAKAKTSPKPAAPAEPSRKSARHRGATNYAEDESSDGGAHDDNGTQAADDVNEPAAMDAADVEADDADPQASAEKDADKENRRASPIPLAPKTRTRSIRKQPVPQKQNQPQEKKDDLPTAPLVATGRLRSPRTARAPPPKTKKRARNQTKDKDEKALYDYTSGSG